MMFKTVNLESGMPSVECAKRLLNQEIQTAKCNHTKIVKIIHGYGSSGKGGAIKTEVYTTLLDKKKKGSIHDVIKGEDFSPFNEATRNALKECPQLSKDLDISQANHGITIVVL